MAIKVTMRYGSHGEKTAGNATGDSSGIVEDGGSTVLFFAAGGLYELFVYDYNNSTGAFRFGGKWLIAVPEEANFSSTAPTRISIATSGTSAHSFTWAAGGGTCTLTATSGTYNVKYSVKRIL